MKLLISLICLFSLLSCYQSDKNYVNKEYYNTLKFFPKKFTNHFPTRFERKSVGSFVSVTDENSSLNISLILSKDLDTTNYKNKYDSLKNNAIATYEPQDTCLLIIDEMRNKSNEFKPHHEFEQKSEFNSCTLDKLPITNFFMTDYHQVENVNRLQDDFDIFVLEAEEGKHWDDKYLCDGCNMPDGWEYGYSKGIAISEDKKVIIYWFVIW
jgi:hypothetical protein